MTQTTLYAGHNVRITIIEKNLSIVDALRKVEKQADQSIAYNVSQLRNAPNKDLDIREATLNEALSVILKGTGFTFSIQDDYILIVPEKPKQADNRQVTGRVLDETGAPLIGAGITIEGTSEGEITDLEGRFSIRVPKNAILRITYIGYLPQSVTIVPERNNYEITLYPDTKALEGVVITALGIKREEKALSYNVQQIKAEKLTQVKDANFINSLNGKVAGVNINASSSGTGGASKVIMRGSKSIEQSSNALYVIDGIPMFNFGGGGGKEFDSRGATESIADINPDDIESMSVLTGAAAAALYGSNAANGAILITTKKGMSGKPQITFSSNTEWTKPFFLPRFQNSYGTGSRGDALASTILSWGPKLMQSRGYTPNDFFRTGNVYTNSLTLSAGNEHNQTFASVASVNSRGFIPNNGYNRYNFTFRNTTSFFEDRVKLDVGGSYIIQNDRNMTNQGVYSNPLVPAYLFPRGDDFENIKIFERWDPARLIKTQYWPQGEGDLRMQNPYWIAYRNLRDANKKRYMLSAQLTCDVFDWLNVSGRARVDNGNGEFEQKLYAGSNPTITEGGTQGHYTVAWNKERQTYADLIANINKKFGDFSLIANIGAGISDTKFDEFSYRGPIRENGLPNVFVVQDLDNAKKKARMEGWREQTQSIFANVEVGWKNMLYLTLTGRNDWASQLANSSRKSFFYPSVGLSVILSQIADMPSYVDLLKVRGSLSSVGMPYKRHLTSPTYAYDETTRTWKPRTHYPIGDLLPERTTSYELGLDAKLWKSFSLAFTWYLADTFNQTFDPHISVSSGYSTIYLQTGSVRNSGIELSLGYGHDWRDFSWDTGFTLSVNKNKINGLVDNYLHPETGEIISKDRLEIKGLGKAKFILKKGGTLGDLYTNSDLKRDNNGMIEIDGTGALVTVDNCSDIKLGSVFPKANIAWRNDFAFKRFSAGATITARIGGIVYSATQAALDQYGVSEASANAREAGGVLVNGRTMVDPQTWYTAIGSSSGIPQFYTYSATNVRLQEAYIGYSIPKKWLGNIAGLKISIVGRNLWMIYNRAPFDPEAVASTGNYYQGIDYFMLPSTRNIGVNVKLTF